MGLGYGPQLDGLGAIAIGLVGVEHFGWPWVRTHFPIGAGALRVQLLFILSGFLITRNLLFRLEQACGRSHPQFLSYNSIGDPDKARCFLGFQAEHSLAAGLAKTIVT